MTAINKIEILYARFFDTLRDIAGDWLMGLIARLCFGSVLLVYFMNSVATKVGSGFPGFLVPKPGAYAQIVPAIADAVSYDVSKISFIPWGLIVYGGTYAEFLLPILVVLGLFTRGVSLAMLGFIGVMTFVDISFHGVTPETIGAFFDRIHDSPIADQRLLWAAPLIYLVLNGAGPVSLDGLIAKMRRGS